MTDIHPIIDILSRWPSRAAILEDVNRDRPEGAKIEMVAVHRWHQRKSIPKAYDSALIDGASRRNIPLNWRELMDARVTHTDQGGHTGAVIQGQAAE